MVVQSGLDFKFESRTHRKEKALKLLNFRAFSLSPLYTMASPNSE